METPQEVLDALESLQGSSKDTVLDYINKLQDELSSLKGESMDDTEDKNDNAKEVNDDDDTDYPPLYSSGEDYDKASDAKQQAADHKSSGNWQAALEQYNIAVQAAPPSALLLANRATCLLQLDQPQAALRDCNEALKENPDSAKALRVRGQVRKLMEDYELALKDLSAAQAIDYDESIVEDLKFLTEKHLEAEKSDAAKRIEEEEKMRKKAADIKAKREEEERQKKEKQQQEQSSARGMPGGGMPGGGMPSGGMPGGMPGMGGMGDMAGMAQMLMSDPELASALQNPKVQKAFQEIMSGPGGPMGLLSNPGKLQGLMSDPEVGPVISKIMSKFGAGGMPGMGGGGMPGGTGAARDDDMDDIPDI